MARLAIAKSFLAEYARLDKDAQSAVDAAIAKFAKHPDPELYLKKPQHGWDDRIRLIEVDSCWRCVVLAPATGNTYCLVRVLPLDEANEYCASRRFSVNPALGVLDIRDEEAIQQLRSSLQLAAGPDRERLLADVSDADLARLGVDAHTLPTIRLLTSESDLERLQAALPEAQYTAVHALACGMTVNEAREEVARLHTADTPPQQVDRDDLVSAMHRSPDQVTFVSGQDELQRILSHPFAAWRTFLHPSQREIAYRPSYTGPAQVTGGPGTGKTVTLLHRAAFLAERLEPGSRQILVTTFNGTLADALGAQLDLLIRHDDMRRRIEVLNVDRLAYGIVKEARGAPVIIDERVLRDHWAKAAPAVGLDLTPAFLKNEWEQVILAQDLQSEQAYLTCLRTGRGRPLTKAQRGLVWQAAQQVTAELAAARQSTHLQLANEATHLLRQAGAPRYRHILVDEAQDLHPSQWRLLRAAVAPGPDDLFIAADPHQRIYDNRVSLASMRINVRGRSRRLSLNYRTTREILAWAVPLLGANPVTGLDGEVDSLLGYRSPVHGPPPQLRLAAARSEELALLTDRLRTWLAAGIEPQAIGITARSASLVREAREMLKSDGIMTIPLSDRGGQKAIRAGTMHAMKGLEFQAAAVIGVEQGLVPEPAAVTPVTEDPVANAQDLQRERCVLFVACTRARDHLYVSASGEPSAFLPPGQSDPSPSPSLSDSDTAAREGPEESASTVQAPRPKVSMRELLRLREDSWGPRLRGASLVAEVDLRPDLTRQVASVLGRLYANLQDPRTEGEPFLLRWPACLAAAMAGVAVTHYRGGAYWPALCDATGLQGTPLEQRIWGRAFNAAVARLGMPAFPDLPLHFVGPVLMHAGIPAYCLGDYFGLLLSRRRLDPGMDAESFLAWATAPGRGTRLSQVDKPAERFLLNGGDYAYDIVDRTLDLLDRLAEPDPDFDGVRLPSYMIEEAKKEFAARRLDLSGTGKRRMSGHGAVAIRRQVQPRIALDPYGQGVHVLLPAVGDTPDGVARWRITADGETYTVQSRATWVGAAETTPPTAYPLARPVRTVLVSLAGREDLSAELRVIDQADPVLFFSDDGRRLAATVSLPRSQVWIMYPAERELEFTGQPGQIAEPAVPFGWDGWRLRLVSLENVQVVGLQGGRPHQVELQGRPRLLLGEPLPGVATPFGSPVYPLPPRLQLPQQAGADIRWYVEIRRMGDDGNPLVGRSVDPGDDTDIWEGVPRPILGAFEVTVRGPLGRGMRRTIVVAEGLSVSYIPSMRPLTGMGLAKGKASSSAAIGAMVSPALLSFEPGEKARPVEYRTATESEPFVVTPPHAALLCPGAGVTAWSTSVLHLETETFADVGRLLVRVPTSIQGSQEAQVSQLELAVHVRGQEVQTIPASGQQSAGLAGFELARAADTITAAGRAELTVNLGRMLMPVAYVRPRRLASGVGLTGDKLVLHDAATVDGLTAGVYFVYAPWRPPVELVVSADGTAELPAHLRQAGSLRVLLRIDDPWTVSNWPAWPGSGAYDCAGPGVPASDDAEEERLSRFVAGEGELPEITNHLGWLWKLVDLAAELVPAGVRADLAECCADVLRRQTRAALLALADEELGQADAVHALISTGLAAAPCEHAAWTPDEQRTMERLWARLPAIAAVASGSLFDQENVADAATVQCGSSFTAIWEGDPDPYATVGRFGQDAERMALLPPEQVEALWQAAAVVPQAMLDADTRATAARRMFDSRNTPPMRAAAVDARTATRAANQLISYGQYPNLADAITARQPQDKGGWLALPAMSIAMALLARLAAMGNSNCAMLEREYRGKWANLAMQAPELVAIDLVLAEVLVVAAVTEKTNQSEELLWPTGSTHWRRAP